MIDGLLFLGMDTHALFVPAHAGVLEVLALLLFLAGTLTIFLTRTRGSFWSIRPEQILMLVVFSAQIVATLISV